MAKRRDAGDGALYQIRGGSLWRGVVQAGYDATGKRVRYEVHARTKVACRDKLEELKKEIALHGAPINRQIRVSDWAHKWLEEIVKLEVDPKTFSGYRTHVTRRIIPTIGSNRVALLKPSDVRQVLVTARDQGLSESKVRECHIVLSRMLEEARKEKLIPSNPAKDVTRPKVSKTSSRGAFTTDQALAIIKAAIAMPNHAGSRWLFKLLAGPRQGEILGAEINQFDEHESIYTLAWKLEEVPKEHGCEQAADGTYSCGKTRGCPKARWRIKPGFELRHLEGRFCLTRPKSDEPRYIPIIKPLRESILTHMRATAHLPNPHGLIWRNPDGTVISAKQDNTEWRQLLLTAGIITEAENHPGGTNLTGHWARHTTITVLASMGVDLQLIGEIVGHSTEQVTQVYRHARSSERMKAMETLGEAFGQAFSV